MSKEGRLNLRIDLDLLQKTQRIAKKAGVTLTSVVEASFRALVAEEEIRKAKKRALGTEDPEEASQI